MSKANQTRCLPPLIVDEIEAACKNARIGGKIVVFQSTASTNDIAWEYAANPGNDGLCVLAEMQTQGRGRRGRTWFSEPGQSVLCSVLLINTPIESELLTLTAAVATAEAIHQSKYYLGEADPSAPLGTGLDCSAPIQCRIKWPNDILIKERKIAGILVEKRTLQGKSHLVIGIGINCNQTRETFETYDLNLPATSLAIESGLAVDRTKLVCKLLDQLGQWIEIARAGTVHPAETLPQSPIIDRWLQLSGMLGQHVTVEFDGRRHSGFCRGIDPSRGLILQLDNSLVRLFSAAQTSIVPTWSI